MTRNFDVFFDLRLDKRLSKQSRGWWFETPRAHYGISVMCLLSRTYAYYVTFPAPNKHTCTSNKPFSDLSGWIWNKLLIPLGNTIDKIWLWHKLPSIDRVLCIFLSYVPSSFIGHKCNHKSYDILNRNVLGWGEAYFAVHGTLSKT